MIKQTVAGAACIIALLCEHVHSDVQHVCCVSFAHHVGLVFVILICDDIPPVSKHALVSVVAWPARLKRQLLKP